MLPVVTELPNLLGFSLQQLEELFVSIGEKKFRAVQVFRWIHHYGVDSFAAMTDIARNLRDKLTVTTQLTPPKLVAEYISTDGTCKWILDVGAGNNIETVFIPEKTRGTLCISSQVGCALECLFCSTGRQGFNRNLSSAEVIAQLWFAKRQLQSRVEAYDGIVDMNSLRITNVVMMGMGEPLANYANVIIALSIMLHPHAYGLAKKRVTLSTSGMVPAIDKLSMDCPVALAISLHASNDTVRNSIIPLNKKYPLQQLLSACSRYTTLTKHHVTFEYVMLAGVNDSLMHATELTKLVAGIDCKFNLIPFNPFPNSGFVCSSIDTIVAFQHKLQQAGYIATIRKTRGEDITAACGQLAGLVQDKTSRQLKWSSKLTIQAI